jgi:DUF4097 and DUF4098 domain-containing protein YvlB
MRTPRVLLVSLALFAALPAAAAERMMELRLEGGEAVQVHNLVGAVQLVPGEGDVVIRARVQSEKQDVADAIRLRRTNGRDGVEVVVEYPDKLSRVHYEGDEFRRLDATLDYQGRRMRVSSSGGETVRVDLEIIVPAGRNVEVRNEVGGIAADRIDGNLALTARYGAVRVTDSAGQLAVSTGSGRVAVAGFRGNVDTRTGSGATSLENVLGHVQAKTGSGGATLRGVDGDISAETGSGSVRVNDAVGSLNARTGSGSVRVEGLTAGPDINIATGSGSVTVAGDLGRVRELLVRTGSGSVTVDSTSPLSLAVKLSTGSGGFRVDVPVLSNVESGRRSFSAVLGEGAGTGRITTGSGSIRMTSP